LVNSGRNIAQNMQCGSYTTHSILLTKN